MRISDWSSDVCSSDLILDARRKAMELKGSKTEDNLNAAFAGESQANRRYLYFAQQADIEGYNDVAAVFRSTAEGETGHEHGHLEFLQSRSAASTPELQSLMPKLFAAFCLKKKNQTY